MGFVGGLIDTMLCDIAWHKFKSATQTLDDSIKFGHSEKCTEIWNNLPLKSGKLFQIFVAFSEYLNFSNLGHPTNPTKE